MTRPKTVRALYVSAVLVTLIFAGAARAATLTVTTAADGDQSGVGSCATGGACTLREAVNQANLDTGDTITLPASTTAYALDSSFGPLAFTANATLAGGGASGTVIGGAGGTGIVTVAAPASVTVRGVTLENGSAARGGAAFVSAGASLTLSGDTLTGNAAVNGGGAIDNQGALTIAASALIDNGTGASGGAILDHGTALSVSDSTISGNSATVDGGGVDVGTGGVLDESFVNDTIAANAAGAAGGDVAVGGGVPPLFDNTIVAAGTAPSGPDCSNVVNSGGGNLEDAGACGFTAPTDHVDTAPRLGPLQSNGGPSETMALLPGSPAIDAGSNAVCPTSDQRGVPRPQGAACDIGAYESAPPVLGPASASSVGTTTASLSAPVTNPDVQGGLMGFQFGTSVAYGMGSSAFALLAGMPATAFPVALAGLDPGTVYHYRVVAENPDGVVVGPDQQFTTAGTPRTPPSNQFLIEGLSVASSGRITVTLAVGDAGSFTGKATFSVRIRKHVVARYTYGSGAATSAGASTVRLTIGLSGSGARELKKIAHANVKVAVSFTPTGGTPRTESTTLTVTRSRRGRYS